MKGLGFRHPLANHFPTRISEERTLQILGAVKLGDPAAMEELILGHMQYACALVSRYLASNNSTVLADDLSEAAFYGLVDGVNAIMRNGLSHDNVTGYLAKRIHGEIRNYLSGRCIISSPVNVDPPEVGQLSVEPSIDFDNSIEVEEQIQELVADSMDECIIRMLRLGHANIDIARTLGVSRMTINRRIRRIRDAYRELQND